jgi:hypothetical protein
VSRREQIKMSEEEAAAFLAEERTVVCATVGPRGWPHLMPLWYVLRDAPRGEPGSAAPAAPTGLSVLPAPTGSTASQIWAWTYAASQKTRNLERDPRATLQVEAGQQYQELRGVMLECETVIHRDLETVAALGHEIFARYASPPGDPPASELPTEVGEMVDRQALKRVALQFFERRRSTWDHRKLAGVY